MRLRFFSAALCSAALVSLTPLTVSAQEEAAAKAAPALDASWKTRPDARTLTLAIPAPRGQIVDRRGFPLAQTSVRYRVAFQFPLFEEITAPEIIDYAQKRVAIANEKFGREWTLDTEDVVEHYKNRRWLPYLLGRALSKSELAKAGDLSADGLLLHPVYLRSYPNDKLAAHMLGHVGLVRRLSTGPIDRNEPMFEETVGREGLERAFDKQLVGQSGELNVLFDTDGTKLSEELTRQPRPGHNVVTTIDLNFQKYAEAALANRTRSGAAVLLDARTGDILAIASRPSFDPGLYSGGIKPSDYNPLRDDPLAPLFSRAISGAYPPASTFKVVIGMAALESGVISPWSTFNCPPYMTIGKTKMKNWNKNHEGQLDVKGAIKRSCNTWFYQVGIKTGGNPISSMAARLGFGESLGLPIPGAVTGHIPNNAESKEARGFGLTHGDLANISIGQGKVTASPLQVARAMAAIGTGYYVPEVRLVSQIQDLNDHVVEHFPPHPRQALNVEARTLKAIRQGMYDVVHAGNGTGKNASISAAKVCGKTGTAQWIGAENRNLAWFAGYVPAENPRFAFAVVYEGRPHEDVSGGKKAAPIVRDILTKVYANIAGDEEQKKEFRDPAAPKAKPAPSETTSLPPKPPRAVTLDTFSDPPRAEPIDPGPPVEEVPEKKRGLLNRIFNRR